MIEEQKIAKIRGEAAPVERSGDSVELG